MAGREVKVVISADDQASGPLGKVAGNIRSFRDASEHAGQGLGRINNILGDMAREAIGATGPLGRIGEKLLEFGLGGGLFGLFAAGAVLIVKFFTDMGEAAKKAREETDGLIESLKKASPAGQHDERVKQLKLLNDEIARQRAELDQSRNPFAFALKSKEEVDALNASLAYNIYLRNRLLTVGALNLPDLETGETPDQKAARLKREAFIQQQFDASALGIKNAGGPQVVGGGGRVEPRSSGLGGVDPGELPKTLEETTAGALSLHEAFSLIGEVTPAVAEGLDAINNSLLGSIPGFGIVAKAAQKAVQIVAKVEGAIAIAKGAVKLAESIWPFNPAGIASGTKMIAEGSKLAALGGGSGGGGGSYGGGGGGQAFTGSVQAAQQTQRDTIEVMLPPIIPTTDPGVQDWLADVIRNAGGRNVRFTVGVS